MLFCVVVDGAAVETIVVVKSLVTLCVISRVEAGRVSVETSVVPGAVIVSYDVVRLPGTV